MIKSKKPSGQDSKLPSPDLAARWVITAAYLYYVLDSPTMTDADYDGWSNYVADNWDKLTPDRQWALGSADAIRASGHHIKFSSYAVGAAEATYREVHKKEPRVKVLRWDRREDGCSYTTTVPFNG